MNKIYSSQDFIILQLLTKCYISELNIIVKRRNNKYLGSLYSFFEATKLT